MDLISKYNKVKLACKPHSVPTYVGGGHLSGRIIADTLARSTRVLVGASSPAGPPDHNDLADQPLCLILLPVGFADPAASLQLLVVSYTTVSPSPAKSQSPGRQSASLLHFPSGYPARPLAGTVLSGVRTFLDLENQAATTRPA